MAPMEWPNSENRVQPNCSATCSGAWFGSMTPPAPTRIVALPAWNSLCWDNAGSVPLNKGQWIARYAKSIGVTLQGEGEAAAEGYFVHVYVNRNDNTPVRVPDSLRAVLEPLLQDNEGGQA